MRLLLVADENRLRLQSRLYFGSSSAAGGGGQCVLDRLMTREMLRTRPLAATNFPVGSLGSSSDEEARWCTEWDWDGAPDSAERREVAFLAAWLKDNLFYPSSSSSTFFASYEFAYLKVRVLFCSSHVHLSLYLVTIA